MTSFAVTVVVPGNLETRTGGYGYDRRIIAGLRGRGCEVTIVRLDDSFPLPTTAARTEAAAALAAIPDGTLVVIDGLALGALPDEVLPHAARLILVALVHHPLALETGLDARQAAALEASERRALGAVRHVVVTSRATAATLERYAVDAGRITIVEPGTDPAPLARIHRQHHVASEDFRRRWSRTEREPFRRATPNARLKPSRYVESENAVASVDLLCVASLTPRKGYDVLLDALTAIPHDNWTLRCAGGADRDAATAARVRARLDHPRLATRVALVGDMDAGQLAVEYDRADLFVLATLYEGYGMVVAEALARGLPVVSTATGAIADLVGSDAGIVVEPGDGAAFAAALARVIGDAALRRRLADGARRVRDRLPTWDDAVTKMAAVLTGTRDAAHG